MGEKNWSFPCDMDLIGNKYSSLTDVWFDLAVNEPDPFSDATESEEYTEVFFFSCCEIIKPLT